MEKEAHGRLVKIKHYSKRGNRAKRYGINNDEIMISYHELT